MIYFVIVAEICAAFVWGWISVSVIPPVPKTERTVFGIFRRHPERSVVVCGMLVIGGAAALLPVPQSDRFFLAPTVFAVAGVIMLGRLLGRLRRR